MIAHYRRIYPARLHAQTAAMPGVPGDAWRAFLGGRKSTATIKSTANTRIILEQFGLLASTSSIGVQGTDGLSHASRSRT